MPIAEDIVAWAADRPAWQRDSLRRLLETTELSEQDLNELTILCKDGRATLPFDPVEVRHFQPDGGVGDVRIVEIAGVANANALQSDTPLRISSTGITLVYGPNGSGKSGYIRLLKQVCRARGNRPDVLPNVYVVGGEAPSVTFTYAVGDDVRHATWDHDAGAPEELAAISIFDHECASVYTDTQCAVAYLPFGLDLLPRLTDLCATVRFRLDAEIAGLRARTALPQIPPDTEAGQVLRQLDASLRTFSAASRAWNAGDSVVSLKTRRVRDVTWMRLRRTRSERARFREREVISGAPYGGRPPRSRRTWQGWATRILPVKARPAYSVSRHCRLMRRTASSGSTSS